MSMPLDLVLVRHGESEGNLARRRSKKGDHSLFTGEFINRHSSKFRLTDKGIRQAASAGKWIQKNISKEFDRYYVSEYLRALETAAKLKLPKANWYLDFYLRERDWGDMDNMSEEDRATKYSEAVLKCKLDSFFWTPPNGESMAELCLRVDRVLNTLHRECSDKKVIIVCHGEVMWAFRVRLERLSQHDFNKLKKEDGKHNKINNCQIFHYTRKDPESGLVSARMDWMRSICPWDLARSKNNWQEVKRHKYDNSDLLRIAKDSKRLVSG